MDSLGEPCLLACLLVCWAGDGKTQARSIQGAERRPEGMQRGSREGGVMGV